MVRSWVSLIFVRSTSSTFLKKFVFSYFSTTIRASSIILLDLVAAILVWKTFLELEICFSVNFFVTPSYIDANEELHEIVEILKFIGAQQCGYEFPMLEQVGLWLGAGGTLF